MKRTSSQGLGSRVSRQVMGLSIKMLETEESSTLLGLPLDQHGLLNESLAIGISQGHPDIDSNNH